MNIVVPAAGLGIRFQQAGYTLPKILIEARDGKPMIQVAIESLDVYGNYIYLVRSEDYLKYNLDKLLNSFTPNCKIICVDKLTEGPACTVLLAKHLINNNEELLIVVSDEWIKWNPIKFFNLVDKESADGGILTFRATGLQWSYVKVDQNNFITQVAEKQPISNIATAGIHYSRKGSDFIKYAEQMISKDLRVNNEFYVAPVYNEFILDAKKIIAFDVVDSHGLGTPEDLEKFKQLYK